MRTRREGSSKKAAGQVLQLLSLDKAFIQTSAHNTTYIHSLTTSYQIDIVQVSHHHVFKQHATSFKKRDSLVIKESSFFTEQE